jgi:DNA repair protein RadC
VTIKSGDDAYKYLSDMADSDKECFRGLYLNSRYQLIHDEIISVGTLTASLVHPREVFRSAINHGAAALIVAHNHPSGDNAPTDADNAITTQLRLGAEIVGIDLLDHIIVVHNSYRSII